MEYKDLFDDFVKWKKVNGVFTALDYLGIKSNCEQLLLSSVLFFPDLIIVEGSYFLRESRQWGDVEGFWQNTETATNLEETMNDVCLANIFPEDVDEHKFHYLIKIISMSWNMYFSEKYKDLDLCVKPYNDEYDGWSITVYKKDDNRKKPKLETLINIRDAL